jgi:outer membrane immunogenic protein
MSVHTSEEQIEMRNANHTRAIRLRRRVLFGVLSALCVIASPRASAQDPSKFELGADYNFVRANAPPGGCGCISMNGGDGWGAYNFTNSWAAVGQIDAQQASNIGGSSGPNLTLVSFLVGPRYRAHLGDRFTPFAQFLIGGAHASGSLSPTNTVAGASSNAFAMIAGGGLDIGLTPHIAIRAGEVDYYFTEFDNGVNQHQNNLRVAAGIVLRF